MINTLAYYYIGVITPIKDYDAGPRMLCYIFYVHNKLFTEVSESECHCQSLTAFYKTAM